MTIIIPIILVIFILVYFCTDCIGVEGTNKQIRKRKQTKNLIIKKDVPTLPCIMYHVMQATGRGYD